MTNPGEFLFTLGASGWWFMAAAYIVEAFYARAVRGTRQRRVCALAYPPLALSCVVSFLLEGVGSAMKTDWILGPLDLFMAAVWYLQYVRFVNKRDDDDSWGTFIKGVANRLRSSGRRTAHALS